MSNRETLNLEIAALNRTFKVIAVCVWIVAIGVMAYGIPIVYKLLTSDNGVPGATAWMLSPLIEAGLCVALVATPVLAQHEIKAGWVGALRWVAVACTWWLQTADQWTKPNGPDLVGVSTHSIPPAFLFATVEAAAYFIRKMGALIAGKKAELASLNQADANLRAELRDLRTKTAALTNERDAALRESQRLTVEAASTAAANTTEMENLQAAITAAEAATERLRAELAEASTELGNATSEATESATVINDLRAALATSEATITDLRQKLRQARVDASTISLDARRRSHSGGGRSASSKTEPRRRLTDDEAVDLLLNAPADPSNGVPSGDLREWKQGDIVSHLGVGWGRAPRLLEAVTEAQQQRRSDDTAVGE